MSINNNLSLPNFKDKYSILLVVSIIAICGIVYELLISTAASHLLGDSITQFSIIIGLYMSAMGIGAYVSKFADKKLFEKFLIIEIVLSLIGGFSVLSIFMLFSGGGIYYHFVLYFLTLIIGSLVGFEIPLVVRIMEKTFKLKENIANVLAFDYIGGLLGSIAFPLLLLPSLGLIKTSLLIGILNIISGIWLLVRTNYFKNKKFYFLGCFVSLLILILFFIKAKPIANYLEQNFFKDNIIISQQSKYQKIVVTQYHEDIRLFLDGNLQFSGIDEYRYHEGLVHIPISLVPHVERVLVLGGGDGLALRQLLKYPNIKEINLVDLDEKLTNTFKTNSTLKKLNNNSLNSEKVKIINQDAFKYLEKENSFYDFIIVDLPDPRTPALSKLYSKQFYELIKRKLSRTGIMVTQATSPFFSRRAFWCIAESVKAVFHYSNQFHINIMSFGDWGFVLGSKLPLTQERINDIEINVPTEFLTNDVAKNAFIFEKDVSKPKEITASSIFDPIIMQYYIKDWEKW